MVADAQQLQGRKTVVSRLTCTDRLLTAEGVSVGLAGLLPGVPCEVIQLSLAGSHHVYLSEGLWSHNKAESDWSWPPAGSVTPP